MVDFGGLADKGKEFAGEHGDQLKEGVDKGADFVGDKIGQDKVEGVQGKLNDAIDGLGGQQGEQADPQQAPQDGQQ